MQALSAKFDGDCACNSARLHAWMHESASAIRLSLMANPRKTVTEVAGETLREIAVLVSVFYMLDNLMEEAGYPWRVSLAVLGACIIAISIGIFMECYGPSE